jgi:GGDEF domain-containing protein
MKKNAYTLAEKIRQDAENQDNSIDKITISLGICEYDFDSYKNTVKKADIALYKAKELGRNRTVKYSNINIL